MQKDTPDRCPSGATLRTYVQGELADQDRTAVEDHLLDCPLCSDAVLGLAQFGVQDVPNAADLVKMPQASPPLSNPKISRWPARIAAAALILVLVWSGRQYWSATPEERLFTAYFDPVPRYGFEQQRALRPTASSEEILDTRAQAIRYHFGGEYAEALTAWRAYFRSDPFPTDWKPYLLASIASMANGEWMDAENYLNQLPPNLDGPVGEQLEWYRALLALRMEKPALARELLLGIKDSYQTLYGKEGAIALLEELEALD